jgi:outer membrane protein assembly factor BamB
VAPLTPDNGLLGVIDGRVFALADEGTSDRLVVLDGATGKLAWKHDIPLEAGTSQVTVSQVGAGLVLLSGASNLEDDLLNVATGATISSLVVMADAGEPQLCAPGGHLAVVVDENDAIGVLSTDPAYNRTIALPAAGSVSVAVTGTLAYARAESAGAPVYGYDLATGKLKWKVRAPGTSAQAGVDAFNGGFAVLDRSGGMVYR